ncbi:S-linalool synthase-like [Chenopodium quinoa]|uniref:S-linalool synthase-like n=1 Tax=Chenopodium quinoa TaxID=63459 RepID=UPI000B782A1A|nr:S-linalool synthase-like [Chenopodium quinoa]
MREELVNKYHYPPLLSYLEALPSSYQINQATIINNLSADGSLFQSSAATAAAYIAAGNPATLSYLHNLVRACRHGVPSIYPIDEDCIKLYMVNQLQRLGLSDHFHDEIAVLSKDIYSNTIDDGIMMWPRLQEWIKREILVTWMARMDHLDHRKWIEANQDSPLWLGKASYYRISCLNNIDLLRLAKENFEYRQMVYKKELTELIRWSKDWGLMDMGFAREKTTYCYFAIASSASFPYESDVRLIVAKSAVLITIVDDFFDTKGSLDELQTIAKAVQRWDNKGLTSHSKILFDILDNFVGELAKTYHDQHQIDITTSLRNLWYEAIDSWLIEATWRKTGHIPSMSSYLEIGKISVAAHVMVLQASYFLTPTFYPHNINPSQYEAITKLLMKSCRLLNDIQGYEFV